MTKKDKNRRIPKVLNHDSMKRLLEAYGWVCTAGGKHVTKMEKAGNRPITIPNHGEDFGKDLRSRMLRQAGIADRTPVERDEASGE